MPHLTEVSLHFINVNRAVFFNARCFAVSVHHKIKHNFIFIILSKFGKHGRFKHVVNYNLEVII